MKDSTKQRIFWIILAFIIAGLIFAFSSQSSGESANVNEAATDIFFLDEQSESTGVFHSSLLFSPTLRKIASAVLFAFLGFSLFFVFSGVRAGSLLSIGAACLYGVLNEICQAISGGAGGWQDMLIDLSAIVLGVGSAFCLLNLLKCLRKWYDRHSQRRLLEWTQDSLSLASVLQYAVFRFLQASVFQLHYSNRYKILTMLLLIFFGGIRFLYLVLKKFWNLGSRKEQTFFLLHVIMALCLAIPFVLVGWMHDYKALIFLPVCCMCLYDMEPEKICKAFVLTIGVCLAALILCCLSGTVNNIVAPYGRYVGSFGVINTTDFASYFSFLLLIAWCGIRNHKWYISLLFAACTALVTYAVYFYTDSRTALYIGVLTVFFVLWDCLEEKVFRWVKGLRAFGTAVNWLSVLAFPAIGIVVFFLASRFGANDSWALQLENDLSGRLNTVWKPLQRYGVKAFGNTINMYGYGGLTVGFAWNEGNTYLDVAYAMLAIRYGWVITAVVTAIWVWMTIKALKSKRNRIAFALTVFAIHAFSEARILDVNYNIFFVMPFCAFSADENRKNSEKPAGKSMWFQLFAGVAMAGGIYLLLPRMLAWLRTFFYIKGWNAGTSALWSFVFCSALVLFVVFIWKTASLAVKNQNKKLLLSAAGICLLLAGSVFAMNNTIEQARKNVRDELNAEEQIIQQVQAVASMPVYGAEGEEFYKHDGIKLADRIFSVQELGRKKGTLFVKNNVEILEITCSRGLYTQISDESGIYSYDPAVIDSLSNAGYEWTSFCTAKRHCNLRDLAVFNGLSAKDPLLLRDSAKVITSNMEMDQVAGTYQAIFLLSSLSSPFEGEAVTLEILGEAGKQVLYQETLTTDCFDSEGCCEYVLTYEINAVPKVSYAISVKEDVTVIIDDISCRRIR